MEKLTEAVLAYLSAKDAKQTQVALDSMTPAIKADIIATIEDVIATTQSGNDPIKNIASGRVNLAAKNLLRELDELHPADSLM